MIRDSLLVICIVVSLNIISRWFPATDTAIFTYIQGIALGIYVRSYLPAVIKEWMNR